MNNKIATTAVIALLLGVCVFTCIPCTEHISADDVNNVGPTEDNRNIVVVTDQPVTRLSSVDDSVRFQNTLESIGSGDIVVIDGLWIENQNQNTVYADVRTLVDNGNPIMLADDSAEAISADKIGRSTGFSSSADAYGIFYDQTTNTTYCYSVSNEDASKSYDTILQWFDRIAPSPAMTMANDDPREPILCAITESTGGFGTITGESRHTKYSIDDDTALFLTEYNFSADPDTESSIWDNWIAVSDMRIRCEHLDSDLLAQGPTSEESSDKYHVDIKIEDYEGTGLDVIGDWCYDLKESSIDNQSQWEVLDISHDIDERGDDKLSTKVMKPGTISLATRGNNPYIYEETEEYYATFYKDSVVVSDKYEECNADLVVKLF